MTVWQWLFALPTSSLARAKAVAVVRPSQLLVADIELRRIPMLGRSSGGWTLVLLGVLTMAHLGWRWSSQEKRPMESVSGLEIGDALPSLALQPIDESPASTTPQLPTGCKILVYFAPQCPHCGTAAHLDASSAEANPLPMVWLTGSHSAELAGFRALVRPGTPVYFVEDGSKILKIRAFPTAFLVSGDGVIRLIFPYQGGLPHDRLRPYCTGAIAGPRR